MKWQGGIGAAALAAVLVACAAPAAGAPRAHLEFGLDLSSQASQAPTGMRLRAGLPDRDGKPPVLREVVYHLPAGTVLDPTVVPACTATDDELQLRGRDACPAETRVGGGSLVAITGLGPPFDPFPTEATIFQGKGQLIEVFTPPGSDRVVALDHAVIGPETLTLHPPPSPGGPPDGHTTPRDIDFVFPVRSAGGRTFLRTPPSCSRSGWTSRAEVTYDSGEREQATATTPCRTASGAIAPARRLRLAVSPRQVVAGRRVRLRLTASGSPECRAGGVVRLRGRRVNLGPRGSATVRVRFPRAGRYRVALRHAGCPVARASVVVR